MIQINLLHQKPIILGIPSEKDGIKLIVFVLVIALSCAVGTALIIKKKNTVDEVGAQPFVNPTPVVQTTAVATGQLADSVKSTTVNDTTHTRYADMAMAQRLTYEHLFAYALFRELALIVPADVDFTTLTMNGYEQVVGMGGIKSEASTISLFSSLKQDSWDLLPKPASLFREVVGGYQFRFEGSYILQPSALEPLVITESSIPTQAHLQSLKDSVIAIASKTAVTVSGELEAMEPEVEGKYRHYHYALHGQSSFTQFKDFLKEMKNSSQPISVSAVDLHAAGTGLEWKIVVRVTVL